MLEKPRTLALLPLPDALIEGFSRFATSMTAPIGSSRSGCRVGLAPAGKRRLCTAHTRSGHMRGWNPATKQFPASRNKCPTSAFGPDVLNVVSGTASGVFNADASVFSSQVCIMRARRGPVIFLLCIRSHL